MHATHTNLVVWNWGCPLYLSESPREKNKENDAWIPPLEETLTQMFYSQYLTNY